MIFVSGCCATPSQHPNTDLNPSVPVGSLWIETQRSSIFVVRLWTFPTKASRHKAFITQPEWAAERVVVGRRYTPEWCARHSGVTNCHLCCWFILFNPFVYGTWIIKTHFAFMSQPCCCGSVLCSGVALLLPPLVLVEVHTWSCSPRRPCDTKCCWCWWAEWLWNDSAVFFLVNKPFSALTTTSCFLPLHFHSTPSLPLVTWPYGGREHFKKRKRKKATYHAAKLNLTIPSIFCGCFGTNAAAPIWKRDPPTLSGWEGARF